jgi:hypothetical protein
MRLPAEIAARLRGSLLDDVAALASCGGRFAGSASETRAHDWICERLRQIPAITVSEHSFEYEGWERLEASLHLLPDGKTELPCHSLIWCPDTEEAGFNAEVVDLGRGTPQDFDRAKPALAGRIALVRHEYPFSPDTIHRRVKYERSRDEGCVGFIIANPLPDAGLVTGSSGTGAPYDIPALGVPHDVGRLLAGDGDRRARVRIRTRSGRPSGRGRNIIAELPGNSPETVIVCAHYDGHALAESALDNGTGVAAALALAQAFASSPAALNRTLRVIFFTNEEWRLLGSQTYVDALTLGELSRIVLGISLDTLAGSSRLACLTSGFEALEGLVREVATALRREIAVVPLLLANSDHFNFARRGVPAMRLVAGYNDPTARTRYLLTEGDTLDKVGPDELEAATVVAAELAWQALTSASSIAGHKD